MLSRLGGLAIRVWMMLANYSYHIADLCVLHSPSHRRPLPNDVCIEIGVHGVSGLSSSFVNASKEPPEHRGINRKAHRLQLQKR